MIQSRLIDKKVLSFGEWRQAIDQEDIEECGATIRRQEKDLIKLYEIYFKYQTSEKAKTLRNQIHGEIK